MSAWWSSLRRWREERVLQTRPIPEPMWQATLAHYPFLATLNAGETRRLRDMATLFLSQKEFTGAGGLEVTDEMAVAVAAQACLPVLNLGLHWYDGFVCIVLHPDEVVARREVMDEFGVVHEYEEALVGEAPGAGPMVLTWRGVAEAGDAHGPAYNVVIHEFAHVMEMRGDGTEALPPLPNASMNEHWLHVMEASHARFIRRLDAGRDTALDPYGAESLSEFFAVACEGFFVTATTLRNDDPYLYGLLAGFFRQDPAAREEAVNSQTP
ncbi:MAG: zinc-dependent peptidase [Cytophagales bacterium]|nr:zinc-dependent peptidase [Rhizobacter sp.]